MAPHAEEAVYASTLTIPGGLEMTTSKDVLEAAVHGAGPRRVLVTLGYAAWGEGQLESELAENAWLTVAADQRHDFRHAVQKTAMPRAVQCWGCSPGCCRTEAGQRMSGAAPTEAASAVRLAVPAQLQTFLAFDFGSQTHGRGQWATACWGRPARHHHPSRRG